MNICVLNIWCNQFYGCIFLGIFMGLPWLYQGFTLPLSTRIWPTPRWLHPRGIPIAGGFMENPGNQWMRTGGIPISGTPQIIIRFNTEKIAGNQGPSQKYRFLWTSWGKKPPIPMVFIICRCSSYITGWKIHEILCVYIYNTMQMVTNLIYGNIWENDMGTHV